jgi:hypothetical protein
MTARRLVIQIALSMAISFLLLFVGFRLAYDSVIGLAARFVFARWL